MLFLLLHRLFHHMKHNEVVCIGTQVSIFLMAVFHVSPGIQEGLLHLRFLHKLPGKENRTTSVNVPEATTSSAYKKFSGKDEFLHALQILAPRFQLFGTFIPNNANAGGSAVCIQKDLLPYDAIQKHVVTCQGRDRIVNIRSGCRSPVVVNLN